MGWIIKYFINQHKAGHPRCWISFILARVIARAAGFDPAWGYKGRVRYLPGVECRFITGPGYAEMFLEKMVTASQPFIYFREEKKHNRSRDLK